MTKIVQRRRMFAVAAPILFVLIWSTGFIVARGVVPHGSPEFFLAIRLGLTAGLFGIAALIRRQPWPRGRQLLLHLAAGAMLHGVYLCLGWWAVAQGMPAGIMALLGALQPLAVAVASFAFLGERLHGRGWTGLAIAITGVGCVLAPAILRSGVGSVSAASTIAALVSIAAITAGTMIQRGALSADGILVAGSVQTAGGAIVAILATLIVGELRWDGSVTLWASLAWSILALSGAGLALMVWMVRHHGATRMSTLMLLVPPLAAIEAWLLFGERLGPVQLTGFALALGGVLLARSSPRAGAG